MRIQTLAASVGGALLAATVVAVPAVATSGASPFGSTATVLPVSAGHQAAVKPAPKALTDAQQQLVQEFLAAHPAAAQGLAARAQEWKAFATAHPELAAELEKVASLPGDQRKAELSGWLTAHPDQASALKERRQDLRENRRDKVKEQRQKAQDRRERRHDRREASQDSKTPAPSTSGSPSASSSTTT